MKRKLLVAVGPVLAVLGLAAGAIIMADPCDQPAPPDPPIVQPDRNDLGPLDAGSGRDEVRPAPDAPPTQPAGE